MALFQSSNPVLNQDVYNRAVPIAGERMTVRGTVNKMSFLFVLLLAAAVYSWGLIAKEEMGLAGMLAIGGGIVGTILAFIMIFKKTWSAYLAPAYALAEGLFLGAVTALFNAKYQGIAFQAVALTMGTFIAMLVLYRTGVIRATAKLRAIIFTAMMGILIFYLATFVLGIFHVNMPMLALGSPLSIGISLFIVAIAALRLVLNFDEIESGAAQGVPKYFEWYASFSLLLTLIWLYMEILKLLMQFNNRK
ncbi:Bax inhibitor-1/YccA family protein [Chitinophaga sp. 30R24]|uniref:Bax inhibitor-1/YccA family protein n=1 Tax=Chitinophaga sp. 30R24 TaxID=3248838 RepID=UPI003B91A03C